MLHEQALGSWKRIFHGKGRVVAARTQPRQQEQGRQCGHDPRTQPPPLPATMPFKHARAEREGSEGRQ